MSLHVLKAHPLSSSNRRECSDLIHDEILNLPRRCPNLSSSESSEVRKPGVSTHRNTVLSSQRNRLAHDPWVARVKPTGDVRRRNGGHEKGVLPEPVRPERLSHIRIKV